MKVAFFLDNSAFDFSSVDVSEIEKGNPGIGGTEYMFLSVALGLYKRGYDVTFFCMKPINLQSEIHFVVVGSVSEAIRRSEETDIPFLIVRQTALDEVCQYPQLQHLKIIMWVHNYWYYEEQAKAAKSDNISCCVFVSKQQYDKYIDCEINKKSTYIFNFLPDVSADNEMDFGTKENIVVYMGYLGPTKGFHVLAKCWPDVVKKVPDAKLYVLGGGDLYNRQNSLGSRGIAGTDYEKKILSLLGESEETVTFFGISGSNKDQIIRSAKVGVVNPTAYDETFCICAIEFENCGLPIVTRGKNGLLDTVSKNSGIFIPNERSLSRAIIKLLGDNEKAKALGTYGREYVRVKFSKESSIDKWEQLLEILTRAEMPAYEKPTNYYFSDLKWLRIINRRVRKILRLPAKFTVLYFQQAFHAVIYRIKHF